MKRHPLYSLPLLLLTALCLAALAPSCGKQDNELDRLGGNDTLVRPGASDKETTGEENPEDPAEGEIDGNGENGDNGSPEGFVDNQDWSAYDPETYLIGFGGTVEGDEAAAQSLPGEDAGVKVSLNLSTREGTWERGDSVVVYVPSSGATGTYAYDATKGQFRPINESNVVEVGDNLAYVYYPASVCGEPSEGVMPITMPAAVAAGSVEDLGDKVLMAGIIAADQGLEFPVVSFKNLCAILRLRITGCETVSNVTVSNSNICLSGAGSVSFSGSTPALSTSGGAKTMSIDCNVTLDEDTPTDFYVLLPPSASTMNGMTINVTFSQSDDTYTYAPVFTKTRDDSSGGMSFARNKIKKIAFRAGWFSGGDGSADNPYQIATAQDVLNLGSYCRGNEAWKGYNSTAGRNYFRSTVHYLQTDDIDMDDISGEGSIGSSSWHFLASYDGDGHTLSNYYISDDSYKIGVFGLVDGGTIKNIILSGADITNTGTSSGSDTGALVAYLTGGGTVSGCRVVSSSVTGDKCGGIVGFLDEGTVTDCRAHNVTVTTDAGQCGGVVGGSRNGSITNCRCLGANLSDGKGDPSVLSGTSVTGGIAGYIAGNSGTSSISECYVSNTTITSTGESVGGVVGYVNAGGTVTGRSGTSLATCSNGCGAVTITGAARVGGIAGHNDGSIIGTKYNTDSYNSISYGITVRGSNSTQAQVGGVVGRNTGTVSTCYANSVTVRGSEHIGGVVGTQSAATGSIINCLSKNCNITSINSSSVYKNQCGGIVSYLAGGSIDLSGLTDTHGDRDVIQGNSNVGGIAGYTGKNTTITGSGTIAACHNATVTAEQYNAGGIVGRCSGSVSQCIVNGDTTTIASRYYPTGGIIGYIAEVDATSSIASCTVSGITLKAGQKLGGIVGSINKKDVNAVSISSCNASDLSFSEVVTNAGYHTCGGILGFADTTTVSITNCNLTSTTINNPGGYNIGGIVGRSEADLTITECSSSASLYGGYSTAGIIGFHRSGTSTISLCTNSGAIDGGYRIGGLIGLCSGSCPVIDRCINSGNVGTAAHTRYSSGGLVGELRSGIIKSCYVNSSVTVTAQYQVGGLAGFVDSSQAVGVSTEVIIINSGARANVTSTAYDPASSAPNLNSKTGGIVGYLKSHTDRQAVIANCVAFERIIQNTNAENEVICIGGIVGYANTSGNASNCLLYNCYSQTYDNNLRYLNGTTCPWSDASKKKFGGIIGHYGDYAGTIKDCYFRCTQQGIINGTGNTKTNYTKVSGNVKNGTETFSPTLSNGRTLTDVYLYQALTEGSYRVISGDKDLYFAVPQALLDLGEEYYKN